MEAPMATSIVDQIVSGRRMVGYWEDKMRYFANKKSQNIALTKDEEARAESVKRHYAQDGFNPAYKTAVDWLAFEAMINKRAEVIMLERLTDGAPDHAPSRSQRKQSASYIRSWRN